MCIRIALIFFLRFKCANESKMFRRSNGTFFKWKEANCGADRLWKYDNVSPWEACVSYSCPPIPWPSEDKNYQVGKIAIAISIQRNLHLGLRVFIRVKM